MAARAGLLARDRPLARGAPRAPASAARLDAAGAATVCALLLLTLAAAAWARRGRAAPSAPRDFLLRLPESFRDWRREDRALTPEEQRALQPDAALIRRFQAPDGRVVELTVVAGHRKQSVHSPGYCMQGSGWDLLAQRHRALALPGGAVEANQALLTRGGRRMLATYFFTDGAECTPSLARYQARHLLRRLRGETPVGALVSMHVTRVASAEEAERLTQEFAAMMVPPVLDAIRAAREGRPPAARERAPGPARALQ
jgi:EpsI family protein